MPKTKKKTPPKKDSFLNGLRSLIAARDLLNKKIATIASLMREVTRESQPVEAPDRAAAWSRRAAMMQSKAGGPKRLQCPKCDRRFALPLHLGRHMAVTHKKGR